VTHFGIFDSKRTTVGATAQPDENSESCNETDDVRRMSMNVDKICAREFGVTHKAGQEENGP
jgi:hypothetical protein